MSWSSLNRYDLSNLLGFHCHLFIAWPMTFSQLDNALTARLSNVQILCASICHWCQYLSLVSVSVTGVSICWTVTKVHLQLWQG